MYLVIGCFANISKDSNILFVCTKRIVIYMEELAYSLHLDSDKKEKIYQEKMVKIILVVILL